MKYSDLFRTILSLLLLFINLNLSYAQCPMPTRSFIPRSPFASNEIMTSYGFEELECFYVKDLKHVYYNYIRDIGSSRAIITQSYHIINGADPETFNCIKESPNFSYDKIHVYYAGFKIESANPKNFQLLASRYSKDSTSIYHQTCKIDGADRNTFKIMGDDYYSYAYDKNYAYFYNDKVKIDILTFKALSSNVFEDKHYEYHLINEKIEKHKKKPTIVKQTDSEKFALVIDNNWNINKLTIKKSNEIDFLKSVNIKNFELERLNEDENQLLYYNPFTHLYFIFTKGNNIENKKNIILNKYSISNFKYVSFANGLYKGITFKDALKLFDKNQIENYEELERTNIMVIKKENRKITLGFNSSIDFTGKNILLDIIVE